MTTAIAGSSRTTIRGGNGKMPGCRLEGADSLYDVASDHRSEIDAPKATLPLTCDLLSGATTPATPSADPPTPPWSRRSIGGLFLIETSTTSATFPARLRWQTAKSCSSSGRSTADGQLDAKFGYDPYGNLS